MKKSLLIAVLATLPLSMPLAWADEAHHSDQDKKPATAMTDKDKQMQMGKMQENMLRMHEQMHKIMQSKDAKEREKLMQEHLKMMQDNMKVMQGMMGGHGMMGGDAKGGKMDGGMKGMKGM
ncbi:MAG: hypothetical protein ACYC2E_11675 [Sulfuricella sp.]